MSVAQLMDRAEKLKNYIEKCSEQRPVASPPQERATYTLRSPGFGGGDALQRAISLVQRATEYDNAKEYAKALPYYQQALECFLTAMQSTKVFL